MRKMCIWAVLLITSLLCAGFRVQSAEAEMFAMVNSVRAANSLEAFTLNFEATRVAKYKCEELAELNYLSHYSPVYGNPGEMLAHFGVGYGMVGENLDAGAYSPRETMARWLDTPACRDNILHLEYEEIGVGYYRDTSTGNSYWVLLFIS